MPCTPRSRFSTKVTSFVREQALYASADLREMMPAVRDILPNSDGALKTADGWTFPPCIVMEKGEALDDWAARIRPDFPTVLMVLCHICARLQLLHRSGFAHRDLKPANCLWRPTVHSWTLIDFGGAGEIGMLCAV
jgi:serine/threonine protein kinase